MGAKSGSHNFIFVIVIVFVKKPSSLRYFRAKAQVEDFMRFSETIFRDNALYPTPLTPISLSGFSSFSEIEGYDSFILLVFWPAHSKFKAII